MTVSLALAKQHLEYEADDRDELIQSYINAAVIAVTQYTGLESIDNAELDAAVLLIVGQMFAEREGDGEHIMGMPPAAEALCYRHRIMAV